MAKCTFCGLQIKPGTGKMFVYTSGKISYFCSTKCEKNTFKLHHKSLTTRWTVDARNERKKGGSAATAKKKALAQEMEETSQKPAEDEL